MLQSVLESLISPLLLLLLQRHTGSLYRDAVLPLVGSSRALCQCSRTLSSVDADDNVHKM